MRQYPKTENAVVTVTTTYYGADAQTVAGFITQPLEAAIAQAQGIDYLSSSSLTGVSTITATLALNYDSNRALTEILMEETGTLGVRVKEEPRIVAERERKAYRFMISGEEFSVRVKVSKHAGRIISAKPEFEDMKIAAAALKKPLKDVINEVQRQIPGFVQY